MIPFMRSHSELMIITQSSEKFSKLNEREEENSSFSKSNNSTKQVTCKGKIVLGLPDVPDIKRKKWAKRKKAISRFLDELDYNNQIQSSYDLTLQERQNDYSQHNAA